MDSSSFLLIYNNIIFFLLSEIEQKSYCGAKEALNVLDLLPRMVDHFLHWGSGRELITFNKINR
jgi:hypothetical protein